MQQFKFGTVGMTEAKAAPSSSQQKKTESLRQPLCPQMMRKMKLVMQTEMRKVRKKMRRVMGGVIAFLVASMS
jgi:hypothetical protein